MTFVGDFEEILGEPLNSEKPLICSLCLENGVNPPIPHLKLALVMLYVW